MCRYAELTFHQHLYRSRALSGDIDCFNLARSAYVITPYSGPRLNAVIGTTSAEHTSALMALRFRGTLCLYIHRGRYTVGTYAVPTCLLADCLAFIGEGAGAECTFVEDSPSVSRTQSSDDSVGLHAIGTDAVGAGAGGGFVTGCRIPGAECTFAEDELSVSRTQSSDTTRPASRHGM